MSIFSSLFKALTYYLQRKAERASYETVKEAYEQLEHVEEQIKRCIASSDEHSSERLQYLVIQQRRAKDIYERVSTKYLAAD